MSKMCSIKYGNSAGRIREGKRPNSNWRVVDPKIGLGFNDRPNEGADVGEEAARNRSTAFPGGAVWKRATRLHGYSLGLAIVGLVACLVGIVIGIQMASHSVPAPCSDGSLNCSSHPHAGEGIGIVIVCVVLACILLIVGLIGRLMAEAQLGE
jgi:hypothetical protein